MGFLSREKYRPLNDEESDRLCRQGSEESSSTSSSPNDAPGKQAFFDGKKAFVATNLVIFGFSLLLFLSSRSAGSHRGERNDLIKQTSSFCQSPQSFSNLIS